MNKSNINEPSAETEADSNSNAQNQHVSQPNANTNVSGCTDLVPEDDWEFDDEYLENQPYENCPKCGRDYDHIDMEYQSCSKCGWDAEKEEFKNEIVKEPSEEDFMNGDADILSGEWL